MEFLKIDYLILIKRIHRGCLQQCIKQKNYKLVWAAKCTVEKCKGLSKAFARSNFDRAYHDIGRRIENKTATIHKPE